MEWQNNAQHTSLSPQQQSMKHSATWAASAQLARVIQRGAARAATRTTDGSFQLSTETDPGPKEEER
ncbi:jg18726 [Pararge aegeria aegeria]|uniref:Jg18726 protein n=1 Tax=Pararge aegeria aegeria TaxID=348720 RepID=A0A8S4RM08_9NEOP|nr:jg18726 [Pararge aegeria aegeria]